MTTRSFALTSLVAAIPGVAVMVLIVFGILAASGEIFGSVPLAITAVIALLCGVVAAVLPVALFLKKKPAADAAPTAAAAGGTSGEIVAVDGDTGEVLAVADGSGAEIVAMDTGEFAEADSAEFVEAESAEFEAADDDDPFADFADDEEDDDFFGEAKKK